jgi:hypothetical protein
MIFCFLKGAVARGFILKEPNNKYLRLKYECGSAVLFANIPGNPSGFLKVFSCIREEVSSDYKISRSCPFMKPLYLHNVSVLMRTYKRADYLEVQKMILQYFIGPK